MPVGVPKVPFVVPGEDEATWVDLYHKLFYDRLLFLGQEVEDEISNQLCGMMIYLSLENKNKDLHLFINSPGGDIISGIAIFDTVELVEAKVKTICIGLAASMASLILAGGEITTRLAFPHAWRQIEKTLLYYTLRVMIHEPASYPFDGQAVECIMEADELLVLRQLIITAYSEITRKPFWQINEDMQRDFFMSPEEAQAYGIVDMVGSDMVGVGSFF
uniref:ATP-dependent Clp protease proteolytic subunit n=1 Tax=Lathyrus davidii TaxID=313081 RepID=A0A0F6NED7_LATDA|nr:clp protease proteolytic subunit [Lathyrus davidii]AIK20597.1 clp protease proteolytic subunit [Lathyrus davidii]